MKGKMENPHKQIKKEKNLPLKRSITQNLFQLQLQIMQTSKKQFSKLNQKIICRFQPLALLMFAFVLTQLDQCVAN